MAAPEEGHRMSLRRVMKEPSAFVPICMSVLALTTVFVHIARFGVVREADEGTAAHIWQLLMAAQLPIILFFAVRWLPRNPKSAFAVLALQAAAIIAALAPVFLLHL